MRTFITNHKDYNGNDYFRINEYVTPQNHLYITWPGLFETEEGARKEIEKEKERLERK